VTLCRAPEASGVLYTPARGRVFPEPGVWSVRPLPRIQESR